MFDFQLSVFNCSRRPAWGGPPLLRGGQTLQATTARAARMSGNAKLLKKIDKINPEVGTARLHQRAVCPAPATTPLSHARACRQISASMPRTAGWAQTTRRRRTPPQAGQRLFRCEWASCTTLPRRSARRRNADDLGRPCGTTKGGCTHSSSRCSGLCFSARPQKRFWATWRPRLVWTLMATGRLSLLCMRASLTPAQAQAPPAVPACPLTPDVPARWWSRPRLLGALVASVAARRRRSRSPSVGPGR